MARYTRTPVSTLQGINNELAKVELAMKDTLDRKGVTPNFMDANLDMNSRRILNLPAPLTDQEPLRKGDLPTGVSVSSQYVDDKLADAFALKIFQSPTDGGLTEIQTRTVNGGEVYEVRKASDDSLATIYRDAASPTEILQNGIDNVSGSDGVVSFYISIGAYYIESGNDSVAFITTQSAYTKLEFATIENLKNGIAVGGADVSTGLAALIDANDVSGSTQGYHKVGVGNGDYRLTTIARERVVRGESAWVPDMYLDHYLFGGEDYVAALVVSGTVELEQCGAVGDCVFDESSLPNLSSSGTDNYSSILAAVDSGFDVIGSGDYGVGILSGRPVAGGYFKIKEGQKFTGGRFFALSGGTSNAKALFDIRFKDSYLDVEVFGLGNPGSNGAIADAVALIQTTGRNTVKVSTAYTKRHGVFLLEADDNIINFNVIRDTNRQNLGVGVQLQGSSYNTINGKIILRCGSNGVDYNESTVGGIDESNYDVVISGKASEYNTFDADTIRGVGINNINVSIDDSLDTVIADDDYYGFNIIQRSNNNIFKLKNLENIGRDLPSGGDSYVSAIRLFECSNNRIYIDKLSNVKSGSGAIIKQGAATTDNFVKVGEAKDYGKVFDDSSTYLSSYNELIIGNLTNSGSLYGSEFKYLANTATTSEVGILSDWENNFGITLSVSSNELTITGNGASDKSIKQINAFSSDYVVMSFEYKTSGEPNLGARVGIANADFENTILPESEEFRAIKVCVPVSADGSGDVAFWADKGDNLGRTLVIRNVSMLSPSGKILNRHRTPKLVSAPITGNYSAGDIIKNSNPSEGSPKGWVCTASGSPGVWVSEGVL